MLVPNASGKPCSRYTFWHNAQTGRHPYLHRSSRHKQPPGLVDPLFMYLGPGPTVSEQPRTSERRRRGAGAMLMVEALLYSGP